MSGTAVGDKFVSLRSQTIRTGYPCWIYFKDPGKCDVSKNGSLLIKTDTVVQVRSVHKEGVIVEIVDPATKDFGFCHHDTLAFYFRQMTREEQHNVALVASHEAKRARLGGIKREESD